MRSKRAYVGTAIALLGALPVVGAATYQPFPFQPESRLWIEGTSTVRDFSCKAETLDGSVTPTAAGRRLSLAELDKAVRGAIVVVPIEALECGNATMNGHMHKALKIKEHPAIRFELSQYRVTPAGVEGKAQINGRLQIGGHEKVVSIDATVREEANGVLRVQGSKEIRMSEFGIKPPSLMMGTMKVGDRVVVHFDVVLKS